MLGADLPLIGPGIAKAATFLVGLKNTSTTRWARRQTTLDQAVTAIYNALGPSGLNWLQPIPGDTSTGASHYIVAKSFIARRRARASSSTST